MVISFGSKTKGKFPSQSDWVYFYAETRASLYACVITINIALGLWAESEVSLRGDYESNIRRPKSRSRCYFHPKTLSKVGPTSFVRRINIFFFSQKTCWWLFELLNLRYLQSGLVMLSSDTTNGIRLYEWLLQSSTVAVCNFTHAPIASFSTVCKVVILTDSPTVQNLKHHTWFRGICIYSLHVILQ